MRPAKAGEVSAAEGPDFRALGLPGPLSAEVFGSADDRLVRFEPVKHPTVSRRGWSRVPWLLLEAIGTLRQSAQ